MKKQSIKFTGTYGYECVDENGKVRWSGISGNNLTNQGLQHILEVLFGDTTQQSWFVGIYTSYSGSISDLLGSDIGGALVEFTGYSTARPAYTGIRTNQTYSNVSAKAQFPITASGTIAGSFLASDNSGVASHLLSVDDFNAGSRAVVNNDTLSVWYELTASNV